MESLIDIIIPTFVNTHLFWIIPRRELLLRSGMNRVMKNCERKKIQDPEEICEDKMVAVNIDDLWARGIIKYINHVSRDDIKYVCWLPDYGVMRQVSWVFYLPEEIEKCPPVAKQASLYNVVNLMTDLVLGENGYEFKLKKTTSEIEGVRKVAVDCIETAEKIFFSITNQDQFNTYGDIICLNQDNHKQSLTDLLIEKNLIISDQEMFKSLDNSRAHFKEKYINHSPNWEQQLDRTETENLDKIIFNKKENKNFEIEFSRRTRVDVISN